MSFGVPEYHIPFRAVPNRSHGHPCGFCGTKISVKYLREVDDISQFPVESHASDNTIYACNSCVLKRIWTPKDSPPDNRVKVKRLNERAILPTYGSEEAAGADLYACLEEDVVVMPGQTVFIPTGLAMAIPRSHAGLIYARSGLACKQDLAPANKVGVIDSDYRGEFIVALHNHGNIDRVVTHGDRIAQLVITPVRTPKFVEVPDLDTTDRANGGFGSTGI